jgi:hypothetical protein
MEDMGDDWGFGNLIDINVEFSLQYFFDLLFPLGY